MEQNSETVGLTTKEALQKLHNEIDSVIKQFDNSLKTRYAQHCSGYIHSYIFGIFPSTKRFLWNLF